MFDSTSGRPVGEKVIQTRLLFLLRQWVSSFGKDRSSVPRILLLVGGPGNGKTEAIERLLKNLDDELSLDGRLEAQFQNGMTDVTGGSVSRRVQVATGGLGADGEDVTLILVQDASMMVDGSTMSAPALLLDELREVLEGPGTQIYLCCVNRGILDDALTIALEDVSKESLPVRGLLEAVTLAVSPASNAGSCWPLDSHPDVAVWPMDAESLFGRPSDDSLAPGRVVLEAATDAADWRAFGQCEAGEQCPFCTSRHLLSAPAASTALVDALQGSEVVSGRRWSFRDLFSLVSYLLSGNPSELGPDNPCEAARRLAVSPENTAPFVLLANQYQHLLFHSWSTAASDEMSELAKELRLLQEPILAGLIGFLANGASERLPAVIRDALVELSPLLDPALADPDMLVTLSDGREFRFRDLDVRFSLSVRAGLDYYCSFGTSTLLEREVLEKLSSVDDLLSGPQVTSSQTGSARRLQRMIRDFSCRMTRRSLGALTGALRDRQVIQDYIRIVDSDDKLTQSSISLKLEKLLNNEGHFRISLSTTFGQPPPPRALQAVLDVNEVSIEAAERIHGIRPVSTIKHFNIELGTQSQPIALTYDLYKAVRLLEQGMSTASLPRTAVALLDATRTSWSGAMVRDVKQIKRGQIRLGNGGRVIHFDGEEFLAKVER
jgi:hypothetical protein